MLQKHFSDHDCVQALPGLRWQPCDVDREACDSVASWTRVAGVAERVLPPLCFDVSEPWPPVGPIAAVLCINMARSLSALVHGTNIVAWHEAHLLETRCGGDHAVCNFHCACACFSDRAGECAQQHQHKLGS